MRTWSDEGKLTALSGVTAVAVSLARHGLFKRWDGFEHLLSAFLVHFFAVLFIAAASGLAVKTWHKFFLGVEGGEHEFGVTYRYYATTTILVAAIAWAIVSVIAPGLSDLD